MKSLKKFTLNGKYSVKGGGDEGAGRHKVLRGGLTVWGTERLLGIDTRERKGEEADLGRG